MKEYETYWIDEDGRRMLLDAGKTKNLQHACFNMICQLITIAPSVFTTFDWETDKIIKNIKRGSNPNREHWFAILGDQVISTIEITPKTDK